MASADGEPVDHARAAARHHESRAGLPELAGAAGNRRAPCRRADRRCDDQLFLALRQGLAVIPGSAGWIETLPKRGYRLTAAVHWHGGAGSATPQSGAASSAMPSIAVMPFQVRDQALQDIADQLAEDVVRLLTGLREVVVIAAASTLAARNRTRDAIEWPPYGIALAHWSAPSPQQSAQMTSATLGMCQVDPDLL